MGFNLKMFFLELTRNLEKNSKGELTDQEILEFVKAQYNYAKDCNQL